MQRLSMATLVYYLELLYRELRIPMTLLVYQPICSFRSIFHPNTPVSCVLQTFNVFSTQSSILVLDTLAELLFDGLLLDRRLFDWFLSVSFTSASSAGFSTSSLSLTFSSLFSLSDPFSDVESSFSTLGLDTERYCARSFGSTLFTTSSGLSIKISVGSKASSIWGRLSELYLLSNLSACAGEPGRRQGTSI